MFIFTLFCLSLSFFLFFSYLLMTIHQSSTTPSHATSSSHTWIPPPPPPPPPHAPPPQQLQPQLIPPPAPGPSFQPPFQQPYYYMPEWLGLAPARQPRRYHTVRRVPLTKGNLVLDCPVPVQYLQSTPRRAGSEFEQMRYTAVTSDPANFESYTLRQTSLYRATELFICITMYNVMISIHFQCHQQLTIFIGR